MQGTLRLAYTINRLEPVPTCPILLPAHSPHTLETLDHEQKVKTSNEHPTQPLEEHNRHNGRALTPDCLGLRLVCGGELNAILALQSGSLC